MRILFLGTAAFAVPSLEALLNAGHDILGVVTQPDRPVGRKRIPEPSPVKHAASHHKLAVYQPQRLRKDAAFLQTVRDMSPDLVAYAAYGQILPQSFLDIPRYGSWNVHGSLLPAYRGAAPIQRALMNGDISTGVCVMLAEAGLDTGPVLASQAMEIFPDDNSATLGERMSHIGAELLVNTISAWERGEILPQPQDESLATVAPSIEFEDARLDWSRSAAVLDCFVRGLNPKPGAWTLWKGLPLKVWEAAPSDAESGPAGTLGLADRRVLAACCVGSLELKVVQPPGKRPMPAGDWARGLQGQERFE